MLVEIPPAEVGGVIDGGAGAPRTLGRVSMVVVRGGFADTLPRLTPLAGALAVVVVVPEAVPEEPPPTARPTIAFLLEPVVLLAPTVGVLLEDTVALFEPEFNPATDPATEDTETEPGPGTEAAETAEGAVEGAGEIEDEDGAPLPL